MLPSLVKTDLQIVLNLVLGIVNNEDMVEELKLCNDTL